MKVQDIYTPDPVVVGPDDTLDLAIQRMDEVRVRHLPVVEGGRLLGVVSNRDLLEATGWLPARMRVRYQPPRAVERRRVRDLMHHPTLRAAPDDDLIVVAAEAVAEGFGCMPVLEGGRLVGIVTEHDLLRAVVERGVATDALVERFMTRDPATVLPDETLGEARARMDQQHSRHLPVVGTQGLVGILSDRDLRRERGRGRGDETLVRDAMTHTPATIGSGATLPQAADVMLRAHVDALPVVDEDELVGIVTTIDVLDPCARALNAPARGR